GSNIRSLVGGYWHHSQATFSPHGMQIVFNSDEGGYDGLLWTVNSDGDDPQSIMQPRVGFGFSVDKPDWSPDGTRITFTGIAGGIFTIRPDGTNLRNLNPYAGAGTFSPDGRKMV